MSSPSYIIQNPRNVPNIAQTNNATSILDFTPWMEDGVGGHPTLPPRGVGDGTFIGAGGLLVPPLGWGAEPFGDNCGDIFGTCCCGGDADGVGGFCGGIWWTSIITFWPKVQ
jgi:hypothetical protein